MAKKPTMWTDNCRNLDGATPVRLGGLDVKIPPLTLGQIKRLRVPLSELDGLRYAAMLSDEQVDAVVEVITAAMKRNYPAVTAEELAEVLDLRNLKPVFEAIMAISGLVPSGEKGPESPSTGAGSTAASSPPPDGPTGK